jgi:hypothetical protein
MPAMPAYSYGSLQRFFFLPCHTRYSRTSISLYRYSCASISQAPNGGAILPPGIPLCPLQECGQQPSQGQGPLGALCRSCGTGEMTRRPALRASLLLVALAHSWPRPLTSGADFVCPARDASGQRVGGLLHAADSARHCRAACSNTSGCVGFEHGVAASPDGVAGGAINHTRCYVRGHGGALDVRRAGYRYYSLPHSAPAPGAGVRKLRFPQSGCVHANVTFALSVPLIARWELRHSSSGNLTCSGSGLGNRSNTASQCCLPHGGLFTLRCSSTVVAGWGGGSLHFGSMVFCANFSSGCVLAQRLRSHQVASRHS